MPDITMCSGNGCPVKESCHRYTATPTPDWQSYFMEVPGYYVTRSANNLDAVWECEYYWNETPKEILDTLVKEAQERWEYE